MADRVPIYELHIKPLFRLIDREHMLLFFDLSNYEAVKQNAATILQRLRTTMPPSSAGGPWPPELVALFARWVSGGCSRLLLGRGSNYRLTKFGTSYSVECSVEVPSQQSLCWLEIEDTKPIRRTYRLYVEPVGQGVPSSRTISEDFEEATDLSEVFVVDAAGTHTVQIAVA